MLTTQQKYIFSSGSVNKGKFRVVRLDDVVEQYIKHKEAENLAKKSIMRIRNSLDNLINCLGSGFNYNAISLDNIDDFKKSISYNSVLSKPAFFKAVITDRLPIGGKSVGIGLRGIVTIKIFGDIVEGKDYDAAGVNLIIKKLYDSTFFSNISVTLENGLLKLTVTENPIIIPPIRDE